MSNSGNSFWDTSWEQIDQNRLSQYIKGFDHAPDSIILQLRTRNAKTVCDAGCGCGIYSLKLAANGFQVSGFDISARAAEIARNLLEQASFSGEFKAASVCSTGYPDSRFDAVVSRDVLDHIPKLDALQAIRELRRITKPGGILIFTLDALDAEYETEPHIVTEDGDYLFTEGKWKGMVFHPYSEAEIIDMVPEAVIQKEDSGGMIVKLVKQ